MSINFQQGFKEVRTKVEKNFKYNRECNNCASFYMAEGDTDELCQNSSVLSYDICTGDNNRVWCGYWSSMQRSDRSE